MFDKVLKVVLVLLAVALIGVVVKGVPIQLFIAGPSSSSGGIPLQLLGGGSSGREFQLSTATNGDGNVVVTRMNAYTGTIETFLVTPNGKLTPTDKK